jgi:hypothetical protein
MLSVSNKPFMLSVFMLCVIMLGVVMLGVAMLNVVAPFWGSSQPQARLNFDSKFQVPAKTSFLSKFSKLVKFHEKICSHAIFNFNRMRLSQPPDGSTSPKYKRLCF